MIWNHKSEIGNRKSSCAFTLVELLIVAVVISTIAAAAIPALSATLESMKATALAREIATDLRFAQVLAVQTGSNHRVSFWPPDQAYAVRIWQNGSWELCNHPITKKPWRPVLNDHGRYAGLTMTLANFNSGQNVIFDKYGSPDSGGTVSFTLGALTRTIRVAPLSGKVTVE